MADDDTEDVGPRSRSAPQDTGPAVGPLYVMWENSLEKLKILNYESDYCYKRGRKLFSRVHFIFPAQNLGTQFDEFMELCSWLCTIIGGGSDIFKRDQYDDPTALSNKLILTLRQLDCRLSIQPQTLRKSYGETACSVLDFLTDKALASIKFIWNQPVYQRDDNVEIADVDDEALVDVVDEVEGAQDEEGNVEDTRMEMGEVSLDNSSHQILLPRIDPIEWKIELERVAPKLKLKQQLSMNEWRAHVDMTITSRGHIEKILGETQSDLKGLNKDVTEELNKMRSKERYMNNQFSNLCHEYKEVKSKFEDLEKRSTTTNENVAKLTSDLAEVSERLEELKESFESKDSGIHDTSPLVRIKAALQQIKAEVYAFDLRIGVVSHSVMQARIISTTRRRVGAAQNAKKRRQKNKKSTKDSYADQSDEEDEL